MGLLFFISLNINYYFSLAVSLAEMALLSLLLDMLFLFLLLLPLWQTGVATEQTDNYLIDCGSSSPVSVSADGRVWMGDDGTLKPDMGVSLFTDRFLSVPTNATPTITTTAPFRSARVFTTPAQYVFMIRKPGKHWLRLYFYPYLGEGFDPLAAVVTVKTEPFVLVSEMAIVSEMVSSNSSYVYKEYLMSLTSSAVAVTFFPGSAPGSYAVVSGIELVSVPDGLFAESSFTDLGSVVGSAVGSVVGSIVDSTMEKQALETVHRLNVGGPTISANDDPFARKWLNDDRYHYYIPALARHREVEYSEINANVSFLPAFRNDTAPVPLYKTARMTNLPSDNVTPPTNDGFNLTWVFPVDPNFVYYIRLHFCELFYTKPNQRVFDVYINERVAIGHYDAVVDSGGRFRVDIRSFSIPVLGGEGRRRPVNIRLEAGSNLSANGSCCSAMLNGVEIFKVSDSSNNLQGPLHALVINGTNSANFSNFSSASAVAADVRVRNSVVAGGATAAGVFAVAAIAVAAYFLQKKKAKMEKMTPTTTIMKHPLSAAATTITTTKATAETVTSSSLFAATLPNLCRRFSFAEIVAATNGFDETRVLGVGGFGRVYEGVLGSNSDSSATGKNKIAVKRGNPNSQQGIAEFRTEIEMLSRLRHRHLVSLVGYCKERKEMILVYDYMANGPLRGHLYSNRNKPSSSLYPLSWKQRLEICIGAARGLHYLHTGVAQSIIHRDVKTTNILLDENMVAKVADFGLSKFGPMPDRTHITTAVKGSFGYLDPEYFRLQHLTHKSDVYSFGVVLMEVVCARPVLNPNLPKEQVCLADWARTWQRKGMLDRIIDPYLVGRVDDESLRQVGEVAEKCLADEGVNRPTMGDVLWNLEYALQLHLMACPEEAGEAADDINSNKSASNPIHSNEEVDTNSAHIEIHTSSQI